MIIASIAATSEDGLTEAARVAQDDIVPALLGHRGRRPASTSPAARSSGCSITLDPEKLAANGVSIGQVTGVLAANNLTFPSGAGHERRHPRSRCPRSAGSSSVEQVENLVVGVATPAARARPTASGAPTRRPTLPHRSTRRVPGRPVAPAAPTPVTIGDLGTVEIQGVATTGYARTNGQPALSLSVSKTSDANTVQVADEVTAKLDELAAQHADTVSVTIVSDLSTFIKESRDGLLREGGLGALFAVLTIFLFLFSIRSTIVAAVSIPLSILTALVIMQATGVTLNIMTLGGLAVAVGRVVDDAIVVLENIYRHRAMGESRLDGVDQRPARRSPARSPRPRSRRSACSCRSASSAASCQPVLPALRAHRHVRAARLAPVRADRRPGARLPAHRQGARSTSTRTASRKNSLWIRAYTPAITFALTQPGDQDGRASASPLGLFVATARSRRCSRPRSSTRARRTSSR